MPLIKNILSIALHLFYPHLCSGCGSDLMDEKNILCLKCINDLPHTGFAVFPNNPIEKYFWGRLPLLAAHSEFYFSKESLIQHLIHQLKYKRNTSVGFFLGELMGKSMLNSNRFNNIDALIPLPLYADKERRRGFNQAAVIANGVSAIMNIPIITGNIIRQRPTETQTRKHRTERWENVAGSFAIKNPAALTGKHLLLVDDVVTTGATLEACGNMILRINEVKLSVATIAHAGK